MVVSEIKFTGFIVL